MVKKKTAGGEKGSNRKGGGKSKKPVHQNRFEFKHNLNSKLTKRIAGLPNEGLCGRCTAQVVWRKKYRKYKARKNASKCVSCGAKQVKAAYHTICTPCANKNRCCAKCHFSRDNPDYNRQPNADDVGAEDEDEDGGAAGGGGGGDLGDGDGDGGAAGGSATSAIVQQIQDAEIARLRALDPSRLKERDRRKLARADAKGL
jgi:hypothetical protein